MNGVNKVGKGIRIAFAVLVSVIIFATCMAYTGMYTAKTVVSEKATVRAVVESGVLKDFFASYFGDANYTVDGISFSVNDLYDTLSKQPVFTNYVTDYGYAVVNTVLGKEAQTPTLSTADKQTLADALYTQLYAELQTKYGTLINIIPKTQLAILQQNIKIIITTQIDSAIAQIPSVQDTVNKLQDNQRSLMGIRIVMNLITTATLVIMLLILTVIIGLILFHPYEWMFYTAIPLLVAGVFTLLFAFDIYSVQAYFTTTPAVAKTILDVIRGTLSQGLVHIGSGLVIASIVLFAARFVFGLLNKKENRKPVLQPLANQ